MHTVRSCLSRGQHQVQKPVVKVHHRGKSHLRPLNPQREKSWPREGVFVTAVGQSEATEPAVSHCAHPQSGSSSAAAAEPLLEGNLEVTFIQSYIFPGLQILKSGCNRAICSWPEKLWRDWLGEGRKEAERRKESCSSPGQGKGAATFWKSSETALYSQSLASGPVTN